MSNSERRLQQAREQQRKLRDKREAEEGSLGAFQRLKEFAQKGPIAFCKEALGFEPTNYQAKFLKDSAQFIAQLWSRQSPFLPSRPLSGRQLLQ